MSCIVHISQIIEIIKIYFQFRVITFTKTNLRTREYSVYIAVII